MDNNEVNALSSKTSSTLSLSPTAVGVPSRNGRASSTVRVHDVPAADNPVVGVLHALRLRWPWILLLGLPLSAGLGVLAYQSTPTPYTAHAELLCRPGKFFWETKEDGPKFDVYKQTMMRLVKDPMVITAALNNPETKKLKHVSQSPDVVLEQLIRDLRVSSPAQEFIRVELSGPEADGLAEVVNAVVQAFQVEVLDKEREEKADHLAALQSVLAKETDKLHSQQKQLRDLDKDLGIGSEAQADLVRGSKLERQSQIRKELSQLYPQIIELELLVSDAKPRTEAVPDSTTTGPASSDEVLAWQMKDTEFAALIRQRDSAQRLLNEWRKRVKEPHREIERLTALTKDATEKLQKRQAEIAPVIQGILAKGQSASPKGLSVIQTVAQMEERLEMLKKLQRKYEEELSQTQSDDKNMAAKLIERQALSEDVADLKKMTDTYNEAIQRRTVERANAPPTIRSHRKATKPTVADEKKRTLYTVAGAGGGVGLIAALFILLELITQRVSNISQVRAKTSVPMLGALPLIPVNLSRLRSKKQRLASIYWRDVLCEAFDGVQSMLRHSPSCDGARVIMVASSAEAEGKTTSVSQLAASFARAGHRVLLIDGDFHRPTLPRDFGLTNKEGLCEVLEGKMSWEDVIVSTDLAELDLLPAGHLTDKTRGLLSRAETGKIFRELSLQYNYVFVDSAPVMASADTLSLSKHVDGVLMLVRKDFTRLRRLESALHRFDMIGVPVLGLLSIGLGDSATSYGYGYGYGYHGVKPRHSGADSNGDMARVPQLVDASSTASV